MQEKEQYPDKIKKAVALSYNKGDIAPKVIAKGQGHLAEKIIEKAKEENVPIKEDEKISEVLTKLDLGEYIPQELYEAIAEILVFVDDRDRIKSTIY